LWSIVWINTHSRFFQVCGVKNIHQICCDHIYSSAWRGMRKIMKFVVSDGWNSTAIIQTRAWSPRPKQLVAQVLIYVILP
jgi:hypothetical protein